MERRAFSVTSQTRVNRLVSNILIFPRDKILDPKLLIDQDTLQIKKDKPDFCETVKGIWDTGANITCIDKDILAKIGAPKANEIPVTVASGVQQITNTYWVTLILPNLFSVQLPVAAMSGNLIGMDVIGLGDFATSTIKQHGVEKTRFSFSMPNSRHFNFVRENEDYNKKKRAKKTKRPRNRRK